MQYPKGETFHRNLSTEYTDVPQLLSTLNSNNFSGVVEIEGDDKKGAFFLGSGRILNALVEANGNSTVTVGEAAVKELFGLSGNPNASLNVYKLRAREAEFVAGTLNSEILFRGLTTDFVRLDRFIKKLTNDKHNGYIDIFSKSNEPMGMLFLRDGELVELLVTDGSASPTFVGQKAIPNFLENVAKQGGVFDAYKSPFLPLPKEPDTRTKKYAQVTNAKEPVGRAGEECPPKEILIHVDKEGVDRPEKGRDEFVLALQGGFYAIEKIVDSLSEKGGFQSALKKALLEKSEVYPFLDPFESQFDYHDGKMFVDPEVRTEDFAVGVADCLRLALAQIKKEFPKKMVLPPDLKGAIESTFRPYEHLLKHSGLEIAFL